MTLSFCLVASICPRFFCGSAAMLGESPAALLGASKSGEWRVDGDICYGAPGRVPSSDLTTLCLKNFSGHTLNASVCVPRFSVSGLWWINFGCLPDV